MSHNGHALAKTTLSVTAAKHAASEMIALFNLAMMIATGKTAAGKVPSFFQWARPVSDAIAHAEDLSKTLGTLFHGASEAEKKREKRQAILDAAVKTLEDLLENARTHDNEQNVGTNAASLEAKRTKMEKARAEALVAILTLTGSSVAKDLVLKELAKSKNNEYIQKYLEANVGKNGDINKKLTDVTKSLHTFQNSADEASSGFELATMIVTGKTSAGASPDLDDWLSNISRALDFAGHAKAKLTRVITGRPDEEAEEEKRILTKGIESLKMLLSKSPDNLTAKNKADALGAILANSKSGSTKEQIAELVLKNAARRDIAQHVRKVMSPQSTIVYGAEGAGVGGWGSTNFDRARQSNVNTARVMPAARHGRRGSGAQRRPLPRKAFKKASKKSSKKASKKASQKRVGSRRRGSAARKPQVRCWSSGKGTRRYSLRSKKTSGKYIDTTAYYGETGFADVVKNATNMADNATGGSASSALGSVGSLMKNNASTVTGAIETAASLGGSLLPGPLGILAKKGGDEVANAVGQAMNGDPGDALKNLKSKVDAFSTVAKMMS